MSERNPYAVSEFSNTGDTAADNDPNQHPQMRELISLLSQTRPWVRFIGVLTMIAAVLVVIVGIFMVIGMAATGGGPRAPQLGRFGVVFVYLIMSALYVYPALCLNRYAAAIGKAETTADMANVVEAVLQQKKFWKFCGIMMALVLVIYLSIGVFAFAVALIGMS